MKKKMITPIWMIEKREQYFQEMEQNGYRLDNIRFGFVYHFKKCNSYKSQYFYSLLKSRPEKYEKVPWDSILLCEHQANEIPNNLYGKSLYRMKNQSDLTDLKGVRSVVVLKNLTKDFLLCFFFLLFEIISFFIDYKNYPLWIFIPFTFVPMCWSFIGLLHQRKIVRKYDKKELKHEKDC